MQQSIATQLLRQVEALERQVGHRVWRIGQIESLPDGDENWVETSREADLPFVGCLS